MTESSKTSQKISKNEGLKRSSPVMGSENVAKQQRRENIPLPVVPGSKLPVTRTSTFGASKSMNQNFVKNSLFFTREQTFVGGPSAVDAAKCDSSGDVAPLEAQLKENLPTLSPVVHCKNIVPDLNATTSLQGKSVGGVKGLGSSGGSGASAGIFERTVKAIRKLETEKHITDEFRMKFLTWYGLRATEKERGVVCTFIQTLHDDPACLAAQLIDSFSDTIFKRP